MKKLAKMVLLADFYGPLLTEKQRNAWDLHYQQDLSLAEIAQIEQISRQAVHDLLKRTERILQQYEEKLGLVERFWLEREKLSEVEALLGEFRENDFRYKKVWEQLLDIQQKVKDIFSGI